jgi:hypothetical protein
LAGSRLRARPATGVAGGGRDDAQRWRLEAGPDCGRRGRRIAARRGHAAAADGRAAGGGRRESVAGGVGCTGNGVARAVLLVEDDRRIFLFDALLQFLYSVFVPCRMFLTRKNLIRFELN